MTGFSFYWTAKKLDYKRLGKQRVEADQILKIIKGETPNSRWRNHPAVLMWRGFVGPLTRYRNTMILEWIDRGYKNTMPILPEVEYYNYYPRWLNMQLINSHRSNLLRKDPEYYSQFGWDVPPDLPYFWPTKDNYYENSL